MEHMGMNMNSTSTSSSKPEHGTWEGHILPGSFFIIWSTWWTYSNFRLYFKSGAKKAYLSRSWYDFPIGTSRYPAEPILKMLLPFIGINAELWAGHVSYRRLYNPNTGAFEAGNIQDWQHSAMYAAFIISGLVDLVGLYSPAGLLPQGTEHGFLSISLLVEGILFGFHLKGSALDMRLHLILVLIIFTSSLVCLLEIKYPQSFLLSSIRAQLVLLQGIWFYQIAAILFKDNPAWDPTTHAAVMMVPFFLVMWIMVVTLGNLVLFVAASHLLGKHSTYQQLGQSEEGWRAQNGHAQDMTHDVEMNGNHRQ